MYDVLTAVIKCNEALEDHTRTLSRTNHNEWFLTQVLGTRETFKANETEVLAPIPSL